VDPGTQPENGPSHGGHALAFPAAVCASAVIVGFFVPAMLIAALGALGWLVAVSQRRQRACAEGRSRLESRVASLREDAARLERLREVLDAAGTPIIATDGRGVITVASRSASRTLGGGRSLAGVRFDELFTQPELHEMERLARAGEPGRARLKLPIEGELRTQIVSADALGRGVGCVVTLRDVTELVKASELKADFAANASHELRTPIASIRGAAETLTGPARNDPAMLDRLTAMVAANAARLEALVNDLLDLSKLESADTPAAIAAVNLGEVVAGLREQFEAICTRKRLRIVAEIDPGAATIRTDPVLLDLILRNLVENATKFAREGTEVVVSAGPAPIPPDPVNPPPAGLEGATGVRISVRDEGLGIPIAHQQRIFERFYQVDRARTGGSVQRGTGLGLAIVKHAARRLGGQVGVESVYQQGTTMIVELPRCLG
jgi:two-component system phosphate regulon sensor histidine kinase PhoR